MFDPTCKLLPGMRLLHYSEEEANVLTVLFVGNQDTHLWDPRVALDLPIGTQTHQGEYQQRQVVREQSIGGRRVKRLSHPSTSRDNVSRR